MGWGLFAFMAFTVIVVALVTYMAWRRVRGRQTDIGAGWDLREGERPTLPPGPLPLPTRRPAEPEMFDTDRGWGGTGPPHHGDQRTFGGYGSDHADDEPRRRAEGGSS